MVQVADYAPGADFGPRELRDFEFVWMLRGSAIWTVREGPSGPPEDFALRPGTLALARAGAIDSYHWDDGMSSTHAYVHFGMELDRLGPTAGWPATRSMTASPVLGGICDYLLQLATTPSQRARERSDQLLGLLLDLFLNGPLADPEPSSTSTSRGPSVLLSVPGAAQACVSCRCRARCRRRRIGGAPLPGIPRRARVRAGARAGAGAAGSVGGHPAAEQRFTGRGGDPARLRERVPLLAPFLRGVPHAAWRLPRPRLGPDPLEPIRRAGLLPFAAPLMSTPPVIGAQTTRAALNR